jgi:glycerophosphoryl diester phosphodiesterase
MNSKYDFFKTMLMLLMVCSCHTTKKTLAQLPAFDAEGHRGCRGLMPENTIPAMLHGVDLGVTTLEMDAVFTSDKKIILSHEPFFNHEITTKPDGSFVEQKDERTYNIYKMTYAESQTYDVGLKPHPKFPRQQRLAAHKPLLADVIDSVRAYCARKSLPVPFFNIETKTQPATDNIYHPAPEEFVRGLMEVINSKGMAEKVIIQSFDFRTLKIVHRDFPRMKTSALVDSRDKSPVAEHLNALGFVPTVYSPEQSLVSSQLVKDCHQRHMKIVPWTVNEKARLEELKSLRVDGIISDYPDLF